jgi:hypothetical protein
MAWGRLDERLCNGSCNADECGHCDQAAASDDHDTSPYRRYRRWPIDVMRFRAERLAKRCVTTEVNYRVGARAVVMVRCIRRAVSPESYPCVSAVGSATPERSPPTPGTASSAALLRVLHGLGVVVVTLEVVVRHDCHLPLDWLGRSGSASPAHGVSGRWCGVGEHKCGGVVTAAC